MGKRYRGETWGRPFPERELTALRAAWRQSRPG